jgi:AraC-like DNA-binding protein
MIDPPRHNPLHRHQLINGASPAALRDALMTVLGAREVDLDGEVEDFRASLAFLKLKRLELIFSDSNAAMRMRLPEIGMVKQQIAVRGSGRTFFRDTYLDANPEQTGVIPAGVDMVHHRDAGLAQFVVRIDAAALQTKLSAMVGTAIVKDIVFDTRATFASPDLARLRRQLEFIVSELDHDDAVVPAVVLEEFEQILLVSFLLGNRHNFSGLLERGPMAPAPWQVRLVEEYIEANWNKPITIEALSEATGGSARSIFKAFKETRGSTPMAFVKSVRLAHARRLLQAPDDSGSVIGIAYACGFLNSGHFARDYRITFGELPSTTLANARRRRG